MPQPGLRGLVRRAAELYARLLSALLAIFVLILVFPVTLQVVSRQTSLLPHYIWTEEMARFLLVWTVMLGAIVGQKEGIHFIVDLWPELKGRARAF
ncbi:MAG TPA: TRAP transporter small permease subunit, partial [Roseomonas sp.]|nr:TRAP transporter small permease subunit [Roseomonas sp.]